MIFHHPTFTPHTFHFYELLFSLICVFPDARYSHTFIRADNELFMEYATLNPDGSKTDIMFFPEDSEDYRSFFKSPAGPKAQRMLSDYDAGRLKSNTAYLHLSL